jgi:hypothetical protein
LQSADGLAALRFVALYEGSLVYADHAVAEGAGEMVRGALDPQALVDVAAAALAPGGLVGVPG